MKAVVVEPGRAGSLRLAERERPPVEDGLLVEALAIGICGTDHEIIERGHGEPPRDASDLVLGHESLGRVVATLPDSGFNRDDLVVGMVRRPDPLPCATCAKGHWDMCLNGLYLERGIKGSDGYASQWYSLEPEFAVHVPARLGLGGVLVEPTSIVAKAWRRMSQLTRMNLRPLGSVLVTGAGPIGLLAALLASQRELEVHVLDRTTEGPKPELVRALGAGYHTELEACPETDVVIECTGSTTLIPRVIQRNKANSVVCLTGVSEHAVEEVDIGAINRELVLENDIVFGSVNAGRDDYEFAVAGLLAADPAWLHGLITQRVRLDSWQDAYRRRAGDVKTVLMFDDI